MVTQWEKLDAHVQALIKGLPDSVEELRKFLHVRGIRGVRQDPIQCPLANYFCQELGGEMCSVSGNSVHVITNNGDWFWELPLVCYLFVGRFDVGVFPELEGG